MTASVLVGIAGLALLYFGGEGLVRGSSSVALSLRVSPLVVGLTIVAFGTSAPELVVSVSAALDGADDIAVGNVVGSNIANLALILAVAALIRPAAVQAKLLHVDGPLMALITVVSIYFLANDDRVTRLEGGLLLAALLAYGTYTFIQGRRESEAVQEEFASVASSRPGRTGRDILQIAFGFVGLMVGGKMLVGAAVEVAGSLGVNQAIIGLTIVAVGTSLPELATSMIAASKGHGDIAVGNVVGSNIFNLLGVLGVTSIISPLSREHVGWPSLLVMLAITLLALLMLHTRRQLSRWEGGLLLACYVGYLGWLLVGQAQRSSVPMAVAAPTIDAVADDDPYLVVLGIAQDGGVPQAGTKDHPAWEDLTARRQVVSLALVDPVAAERWLFEATPDLREQLHRLDTVFPVETKPGLSGIFLTHAHMGHYTGLMFFGHESIGASEVPVYAMPRMRGYLAANGPWDQLVRYRNIDLRELMDGTPVRLNDRIAVTPFLVPHRQEYTEVVGFRIDGPNRSVLFIPDIDSWEEFDEWGTRIEDLIAEVDVAYLDATFYANGEIPGRDMSGFPHPFIAHSMERLSGLPAVERRKVRFIHLNHTNPALRQDSEARATIEARGFRVAEELERVGL
jgi:pyrroloquinoline quinone biosynthesis protein B